MIAGAFSSTACEACEFTGLALSARRGKTNSSIPLAVQSLSQVVFVFLLSLS